MENKLAHLIALLMELGPYMFFKGTVGKWNISFLFGNFKQNSFFISWISYSCAFWMTYKSFYEAAEFTCRSAKVRLSDPQRNTKDEIWVSNLPSRCGWPSSIHQPRELLGRQESGLTFIICPQCTILYMLSAFNLSPNHMSHYCF